MSLNGLNWPRKFVHAVMFLACIKEVPSSNLALSACYPDWCFFVVFLSSSRNMTGQYLKLCNDHFLIPSGSLLTHPDTHTMQSILMFYISERSVKIRKINSSSFRFIIVQSEMLPVTVAALSKAWNVFARLNTGIVGSNPARGMDVCVYSVCVVLCR
jgi:hypothetical protein